MRHSFFFAWPLVGRLAAPGVGLDWADDGLRLVQLSADGALVQAQLAWPSTGVPLDGDGVQLLAESLQQLWQQAGVRQRRVRAALPESMLQRRSLRLLHGLRVLPHRHDPDHHVRVAVCGQLVHAGVQHGALEALYSFVELLPAKIFAFISSTFARSSSVSGTAL